MSVFLWLACGMREGIRILSRNGFGKIIGLGAGVMEGGYGGQVIRAYGLRIE